MSFSQDTAKTTGQSRRTIERNVAIADGIVEDVQDAIAGFPIADNKSALAKLAKMPEDEQRAFVKAGKHKAKPKSKPKKNAKPKKESKPKDPPPNSGTWKKIRDLVHVAIQREGHALVAAKLENYAEEIRGQMQ